MTGTMRTRLVAIAAVVVAFIVATFVDDAFRLASFGALRGYVVALVAAGAVASAFGVASARVRGTAPGRCVLVAAISAAVVAFLLLRFPSPWVDLGPLGAGPVTAIAIVVLPLAQICAALAVRRWGEP